MSYVPQMHLISYVPPNAPNVLRTTNAPNVLRTTNAPNVLRTTNAPNILRCHQMHQMSYVPQMHLMYYVPQMHLISYVPPNALNHFHIVAFVYVDGNWDVDEEVVWCVLDWNFNVEFIIVHPKSILVGGPSSFNHEQTSHMYKCINVYILHIYIISNTNNGMFP